MVKITVIRHLGTILMRADVYASEMYNFLNALFFMKSLAVESRR